MQRALHSFPTRRSSDLLGDRLGGVLVADRHVGVAAIGFLKEGGGGRSAFVSLESPRTDPFPEVRRQAAPSEPASAVDTGRSEEHTSELQSQSNLVCRLL